MFKKIVYLTLSIMLSGCVSAQAQLPDAKYIEKPQQPINMTFIGEGENPDKYVAKYLASKQIVEQLKQIDDLSVFHFSEVGNQTVEYNDWSIEYHNNIVCDYHLSETELISDWLDCNEIQKGNKITITCNITDKIRDKIHQNIVEQAQLHEGICKNNFMNIFKYNGKRKEIKIQEGIILSADRYQDHYDTEQNCYYIKTGYQWIGIKTVERELYLCGNFRRTGTTRYPEKVQLLKDYAEWDLETKSWKNLDVID